MPPLATDGAEPSVRLMQTGASGSVPPASFTVTLATAAVEVSSCAEAVTDTVMLPSADGVPETVTLLLSAATTDDRPVPSMPVTLNVATESEVKTIGVMASPTVTVCEAGAAVMTGAFGPAAP